MFSAEMESGVGRPGEPVEIKAEQFREWRRWLRRNLSNAGYVLFEAIEEAASLAQDGWGQVSYAALAEACNVRAAVAVREVRRLVERGLLLVRSEEGRANFYRVGPVSLPPAQAAVTKAAGRVAQGSKSSWQARCAASTRLEVVKRQLAVVARAQQPRPPKPVGKSLKPDIVRGFVAQIERFAKGIWTDFEIGEMAERLVEWGADLSFVERVAQECVVQQFSVNPVRLFVREIEKARASGELSRPASASGEGPLLRLVNWT